MKRNPRPTAEWYAAKMARLRQKFDSHLSDYLVDHDDGNVEANRGPLLRNY
jgi:hypothetical protein